MILPSERVQSTDQFSLTKAAHLLPTSTPVSSSKTSSAADETVLAREHQRLCLYYGLLVVH